MGPLGEGVIQSVILGDPHPQRFESFCNALVSELEGGIAVVPTSRSWDLGRDGRDASGQGLFICATLEAKVSAKSVNDIKRLTEHAVKVSRVYFCSSRLLSEKQCAELEASLRPLLVPDATVSVHGAAQLAALAARTPAIASRHYQAEIEETVALMRGAATDGAPEEEALRLSLMTLGSEASHEIRRSLYFGILCSVFARGPRNSAECARDVSARLSLQRNIPWEVLEPYVRELAETGDIRLDEGRYHLTDAGNARLQGSEGGAAAQIVDGRTRLREAIEKSIGNRLADQHYDRIWAVIRQKMSHFFYTRGQQMVEEVGRLLSDEPSTAGRASTPPPAPLFFIDDLAMAVANTATHPDQREELRTAVRDLFTERTGSAFEWLGSLCAAFVALCSLGLEATTGRAIGRMIASIALVLDTDVVLSLLNLGEADHSSVEAIVKRWRALRGGLLVAEPVLQEVAHHAWIAEADFVAVRSFLPGSAQDRTRLVENSFVRGFAELVASREARLGQWSAYIRQYKGRDEWDSRRIADALRQDFGITVLPAPSGPELDLQRKVDKYLERIVLSRQSGRDLRIARDKARRDAVLYASLVKYYRALRQENPEGICLLARIIHER
jgi:hypothetical protein